MAPAARPGPGHEPHVVLDEAALDRTVGRLAAEVGEHLHDESVVAVVLKGAVIVASDLLRRLAVSPIVDFVAVSPFESGGRARLIADLGTDIGDRDVLLIHDVVDSGLTVDYLLGSLRARRPRSLRVCALVDKPHRRLVPVPIDHVGVTVDHDFLIGYGLDFAGRYRNLPVLAAADLERLGADPDAYLEWARRNRSPESEEAEPSG